MWGNFSSFQIYHSQLMKVLSQAVPLEEGSTSCQKKEGRELHNAKKEQLHHYLIVLKKIYN